MDVSGFAKKFHIFSADRFVKELRDRRDEIDEGDDLLGRFVGLPKNCKKLRFNLVLLFSLRFA